MSGCTSNKQENSELYDELPPLISPSSSHKKLVKDDSDEFTSGCHNYTAGYSSDKFAPQHSSSNTLHNNKYYQEFPSSSSDQSTSEDDSDEDSLACSSNAAGRNCANDYDLNKDPSTNKKFYHAFSSASSYSNSTEDDPEKYTPVHDKDTAGMTTRTSVTPIDSLDHGQSRPYPHPSLVPHNLFQAACSLQPDALPDEHKDILQDLTEKIAYHINFFTIDKNSGKKLKLICQLCRVTLLIKNIENHVRQQEHLHNLTKRCSLSKTDVTSLMDNRDFEFLDYIEASQCYMCTLCNERFSSFDSSVEHFRSSLHRSNVKSTKAGSFRNPASASLSVGSKNSAKNLSTTTMPSNTFNDTDKKLLRNLEKELNMALNDFQLICGKSRQLHLKCKVCKTTFAPKSIPMHVKTEQHKKNLSEHSLIPSEAALRNLNRNQDIIKSLKDKDKKVGQDLLCKLKNKLDNFHPFYESDKLYFKCEVCQLKLLPKNVEAHSYTKAHRSSCDQSLSETKFQVPSESLKKKVTTNEEVIKFLRAKDKKIGLDLVCKLRNKLNNFYPLYECDKLYFKCEACQLKLSPIIVEAHAHTKVHQSNLEQNLSRIECQVPSSNTANEAKLNVVPPSPLKTKSDRKIDSLVLRLNELDRKIILELGEKTEKILKSFKFTPEEADQVYFICNVCKLSLFPRYVKSHFYNCTGVENLLKNYQFVTLEDLSNKNQKIVKTLDSSHVHKLHVFQLLCKLSSNKVYFFCKVCNCALNSGNIKDHIYSDKHSQNLLLHPPKIAYDSLSQDNQMKVKTLRATIKNRMEDFNFAYKIGTEELRFYCKICQVMLRLKTIEKHVKDEHHLNLLKSKIACKLVSKLSSSQSAQTAPPPLKAPLSSEQVPSPSYHQNFVIAHFDVLAKKQKKIVKKYILDRDLKYFEFLQTCSSNVFLLNCKLCEDTLTVPLAQEHLMTSSHLMMSKLDAVFDNFLLLEKHFRCILRDLFNLVGTRSELFCVHHINGDNPQIKCKICGLIMSLSVVDSVWLAKHLDTKKHRSKTTQDISNVQNSIPTDSLGASKLLASTEQVESNLDGNSYHLGATQKINSDELDFVRNIVDDSVLVESTSLETPVSTHQVLNQTPFGQVNNAKFVACKNPPEQKVEEEYCLQNASSEIRSTVIPSNTDQNKSNADHKNSCAKEETVKKLHDFNFTFRHDDTSGPFVCRDCNANLNSKRAGDNKLFVRCHGKSTEKTHSSLNERQSTKDTEPSESTSLETRVSTHQILNQTPFGQVQAPPTTSKSAGMDLSIHTEQAISSCTNLSNSNTGLTLDPGVIIDSEKEVYKALVDKIGLQIQDFEFFNSKTCNKFQLKCKFCLSAVSPGVVEAHINSENHQKFSSLAVFSNRRFYHLSDKNKKIVKRLYNSIGSELRNYRVEATIRFVCNICQASLSTDDVQNHSSTCTAPAKQTDGGEKSTSASGSVSEIPLLHSESSDHPTTVKGESSDHVQNLSSTCTASAKQTDTGEKSTPTPMSVSEIPFLHSESSDHPSTVKKESISHKIDQTSESMNCNTTIADETESVKNEASVFACQYQEPASSGKKKRKRRRKVPQNMLPANLTESDKKLITEETSEGMEQTLENVEQRTAVTVVNNIGNDRSTANSNISTKSHLKNMKPASTRLLQPVGQKKMYTEKPCKISDAFKPSDNDLQKQHARQNLLNNSEQEVSPPEMTPEAFEELKTIVQMMNATDPWYARFECGKIVENYYSSNGERIFTIRCRRSNPIYFCFCLNCGKTVEHHAATNSPGCHLPDESIKIQHYLPSIQNKRDFKEHLINLLTGNVPFSLYQVSGLFEIFYECNVDQSYAQELWLFCRACKTLIHIDTLQEHCNAFHMNKKFEEYAGDGIFVKTREISATEKSNSRGLEHYDEILCQKIFICGTCDCVVTSSSVFQHVNSSSHAHLSSNLNFRIQSYAQYKSYFFFMLFGNLKFEASKFELFFLVDEHFIFCLPCRCLFEPASFFQHLKMNSCTHSNIFAGSKKESYSFLHNKSDSTPLNSSDEPSGSSCSLM
nr:PREDICTED: uncharacterized protein LOC109033482 isoform X2 [Bemisia tabaci]